MNSSDSLPKLPTWIFYALDAVLLGTGWYIAQHAAHPLSPNTIFWVAACVITGALVLLVPLVLRFERQKNETLDDRQRALESLARTVASSAEQISIAAAGLHEIAELAQKNLRQAEQLPPKLQEKIAEFRSVVAQVEDAEKEELEKELATLRSSEGERLESAATKIAKATVEFSKLESATQQHLAAATEALAKLSFGTAGAVGKAQAAAEQAFAHARNEAARGLGDAAGQATHTIESAKAAALAELDARLAQASAAFADKVSRDLMAKLQASTAAVTTPAAPSAEPPSPPDESAKTESVAGPPKRPRKRRDEDVADEPAPTEAGAPPAAAEGAPTSAIATEEPPPLPVAQIAEIAPVAPSTTDPFSIPLLSVPATDAPPADAPATDVPAAKPPRKRPAKKPAALDPEPATPAAEPVDEPAPAEDAVPATPGDRGLTSDGATRLLVTAYIGIGNRLFIRGSGPGLTWEKGVPLQFVSIGKWRWETNDAAEPFQFKIYKNDEVECTALGSQNLDPGYQQEVSAAF